MTSQTLESFAAGIASGTIRTIDLTQTLSPETPTLVLPPEFGQCAGFSQEEISRYDERGVAWYWNNFTVSEHTGTHFDAPIHWITGKDLANNAVDTVPPADFIATAVVIDISAKSAENPDYLLTVADIEAWEAEHGRIPRAAGSCCAPTGRSAMSMPIPTAARMARIPRGPSAEAVQFLIDAREAHGLGVETIGTDAGQAHFLSPAYPAHTLFHAAGRYGLQCLENLDQLPPTGAVILATPLKIKGGSGSPLRVLALVAG
jgi:kynurenine formamidase